LESIKESTGETGVRLLSLAAVSTLVIAVLAVGLAWLADRSLDGYAAPYMDADPARLPAVETALVLGAAPIGPEGGPNRYLAYRLDAAAALWKAGRVKSLIASGAREGQYDEPTYMRERLIERGVPAEAIELDFLGSRTFDSVTRVRRAYGMTRIIIVSQRFHVARAIFLARKNGVEAWGLEARDVDRAYSIFTELRRYPSALRAYWDVWSN
jgi:SanA protein